MKTLFLSPLQPQNAGGGWGGGGRRGYPGFVSLQVPSSRFSRHPRLRNLRGLGGFCGEKAPSPWWAGPQALGARAPSPLETWPTGPWGLDPTTLTDFLQAKFLASCCVYPWIRVSKRSQAPGDLANKPLSPASRSRIPKMPRCSSAHE